MQTVVISDIHLGSKYCLLREFLGFLRSLPDGVRLVLNGDVVDFWHAGLPPEHSRGLQALREESRRRQVVWVRGNHDDRYEMPDPAAIEFVPIYNIGRRLVIAHGYDFDNIMPYNRMFIACFRFLHAVRMRLGAEPTHVAFYAKRFPYLYGVLQRAVAMNAVEYASEKGYEAVTCGHTHLPEERVIRGIRYVNTGAWTESPVHYLLVSDTSLQLEQYKENDDGAQTILDKS